VVSFSCNAGEPVRRQQQGGNLKVAVSGRDRVESTVGIYLTSYVGTIEPTMQGQKLTVYCTSTLKSLKSSFN